MTTKKIRVGFLSYFGWNCGISSIIVNYMKMIQDECDCYVLKHKTIESKTPQSPTHADYIEFFKNWVISNKLDVVVFGEYNQGNEDENELPSLCKELGVKTYGYLSLENFKPTQTFAYDRILASSKSFEKFMRYNRLRNFTYVPASLDMKEFPDSDRPQNDKFVFFHPNGWTGIHDRKNTQAVIDAFENMENVDDCKLIITSQKEIDLSKKLHLNIEVINKPLTRQKIIDLYYASDCVVLPSKWETIEISILESLATSTPVITTNAPPMNEFVKDCYNGYLCSGKSTYYPNTKVEAIDVDVLDLKQKMEMASKNESIHLTLKRNAQKDALEKFDLEKNKKHFLTLLKKDFN